MPASVWRHRRRNARRVRALALAATIPPATLTRSIAKRAQDVIVTWLAAADAGRAEISKNPVHEADCINA
jgi:hypothetical protein